MKRALAGAAAGLALAAAGFAFAAPSPQAAQSLGRSIALAAFNAEAAAQPQQIQPAVRMAAQSEIIAAAAEPVVVLNALDVAVQSCRAAQSGWTCPKSTEAYMALASLRSIIVAQVEQTDPASLDTFGGAALGEVPSVSPGASYSVLR